MSKRKDLSKEISGLLLVILTLLLGLSFGKQWLPALSAGWTCLIYLVIYILPMLIYIRKNRYKKRSALRLKFVSPRYWLFILLFGLSVCLLCTLINVGTNAFAASVLHLRFQNNIVDLSGANPASLIITSVLLPAFCEELLLRGLVQSEYEKYGVTVGVLLTSVIFALFHTSPAQLPSLFIAGVCYGVLTVLFRSVWPAFFAHAINNGVAVLLARHNDFFRYLFQDKLFLILFVVACFLLLIFTLKLMESAVSDLLGKNRQFKKSTRSLAYGDPLLSPWIWLFALLCIGKMVYNAL